MDRDPISREMFEDPSATRRPVEPGSVLIEIGEDLGHVYLVESGSLEVTVSNDGEAVQVAVVGPGEILGEISLLAGGRPTARVTAVESSVIVEVPRDAAARWLERSSAADAVASAARARVNENQLAVLVARLADTDDATVVTDFLDEAVIIDVPAGETVYHRGDPADAAFLVISGRIRTTGGPDGRRGVVGRGQLLGESALFDPGRREDTATATRDAVLARIDVSSFESLVAKHPRVMLNLSRQVLARLRDPSTSGARRVSSLSIAVTAPVDAAATVCTIVDALRPYGVVGHLTTRTIDRDLGREGIANSEHSDVGAPRLSSYLHEFELAHDIVVLGVDPSDSDNWAARAAAIADRAVVVISPDPDAAERSEIGRIRAATPSTTTLIGVVIHPSDTDRPRGTATLASEIGLDDVFHARDGSDADLERAARLVTSRAVGLALSGGGGRGFGHLGVFRALAATGVPVDMIVGASIGAPLGGTFAQGVPIDRHVPVLTELFHDLLDYTIPVVSLIKAERITRSIERAFAGWDFEDMWIPFRCVSTNLTRSRTEVHRAGPVAPRVRASVAIPGVMPPVPDGDDLLVDGGVLNNLPVDVLATEGRCSTIIAVDVAPPVGPSAKADYGLSVSGWSALRSTFSRGSPTYPGISSVMLRSMLIGSMRDRQRMLEEAPVDLHLELDLRDIGLLEFDRVSDGADRGREIAEPLIRQWLTERGGWR